MALNTGGFALTAAPHAPPIPGNVGKIDVSSIYDRVVQGMQTNEAMRTALARQQATDAGLGADRATALARTAVAPEQATADIAKARETAALASPAIVGGEVAKTTTGLDADLAAEQARRDNAKFLLNLSPAQRLVLAAHGPSTGTVATTTRQPGGNVQSVNEQTAYIGGQPVPLARSEADYPSTPVVTPVPGFNGAPGPNVISTIGPDGKPSVHVSQYPLAALNNINQGTTYKVIGQRKDDQGNDKFMVQAFTSSAAGGAPKPVGAPTEVNSVAGLPGIEQGATGAQPFISADAQKAIADTQETLTGLNGRKIELQNIANAAEKFTKDTTGKFIGPIRNFLGDADAQGFVGSVQNALSSALQPLRGTGRVSNTEFNQALSALPKVTDQAEVIANKLQYLNLVTDWATARNQAILDNLGKGLNRYQAYAQAQKDVPIPEVPNFYEGATAAPITAPGASTAAPTHVGGFKIIKVEPAATAKP